MKHTQGCCMPEWHTVTTLEDKHNHTHSYTLTRTDATRCLPPHTCPHTHTVLERRGEKRRGSEGDKDFSIFYGFCRHVTNRRWLWEETTVWTLTNTHTHLPPLQSQILGLVCLTVACGSQGVDQHGKPSRETGGDGVRSDSCVLKLLVCLSVCPPVCSCKAAEYNRSELISECFAGRQVLINGILQDAHQQSSGGPLSLRLEET